MKKLISILLILCFTGNIAFASEWVLKKKNIEDYYKWVDSSLIRRYLTNEWLYLGNYGASISLPYMLLISPAYLAIDSIQMIFNNNSNTFNKVCGVFGAIAGIEMVGLGPIYYAHPSYFFDYTKKWNEAIDKRDMTYFKNEYLSGGKSAIKTGGISLLIGLFVKNTMFHWKNHINLFGYTQLLSGIVYIIQAKRLDKAVFKEDEKQTLLSPFIISPMIRPDCSGIMLVKRF